MINDLRIQSQLIIASRFQNRCRLCNSARGELDTRFTICIFSYSRDLGFRALRPTAHDLVCSMHLMLRGIPEECPPDPLTLVASGYKGKSDPGSS